jgi:hypothetical protein
VRENVSKTAEEVIGELDEMIATPIPDEVGEPAFSADVMKVLGDLKGICDARVHENRPGQ